MESNRGTSGSVAFGAVLDKLRAVMTDSTLLWFRQDLRLEDNPALAAAIERGAVIPVYIWSPEREGAWAPGGAARWWLHHALADLGEQLDARGVKLVLRAGPPEKVLRALREETGATAVYWNRRYEPAAVLADSELKASLGEEDIAVRSFNASLLHEPWEVCTQNGDPYRVFTPFSRAVAKLEEPKVVPVPLDALKGVGASPSSEALEDWGLLPELDWDGGFSEAWTPTRESAQARLKAFLGGAVDEYLEERDWPAEDGTSRLSPYLHWGQLGPREVAAAIRQRAESKGGAGYHRQLVWRDFGHHVLFHFSHTPEAPLQDSFKHFPWREDAKSLEAWQKGQTGYPIVDAGMRQLWATGWMHNRVRMVVASLLVKHLLISWREGADWFWDCLVDADLANNTLGWQWAGGCGADAAPYFRIFNPITQGTKFDPEGAYVRRWVPELEKLPAKFIHEPWEAPAGVLAKAGVKLGETYPRPLIEHKAGRERALDAFQTYKDRRS